MLVALPATAAADLRSCELWVQGTTAGPPARAGHGMVWDSARGRVILFGGLGLVGGDYTSFSDLWEYDPGAGVWQEIPLGVRPLPRFSHAMAYDAARARVVLFGGQIDTDDGDPASFLNDTWEYDPAAHTWTRHSIPFTGRPGARANGALAYDAQRGVAVLFGGNDDSDELAIDGTAEWNGSTWTFPRPAHAPPARTSHAMTYSFAFGGVVVFGGISVTEDLFEDLYDDAWVYNGVDWTALPNPAVDGRHGHALTTGPRGDQLIVYGGFDFDAGTTLARESAAGAWTAVRTGPPRVAGTAMVQAAGGTQVVLFGGVVKDLNGGDDVYSGETWILKGLSPVLGPLGPAADSIATPCVTNYLGATTIAPDLGPFSYEWRRRYPDGQWHDLRDHGPVSGTGTDVLTFAPLRAIDVGTYDVVVSNACGATVSPDYRIRLADGHWEPGAFLPDGRNGFAMAYDSDRETMVIHGGQTIGIGVPAVFHQGSWESASGQAWAFAADPGPSPRAFHAAAYDPERHRTVLFGGYWQGPPGPGPAPAAKQTFAETWEYDGTTWTQKHPAESPDARSGHAMTWDPVRKRVVLFGGTTHAGTVATPALWEWDGSTWSLRPGIGDPTIGPSGAPLNYPPGRDQTGFAFDTKRGALMVHGGSTYLANPNDPNFKRGDTWEQLGLQWKRRNFFTDYARALVGEHRAMAYDVKHDAMLLFTFSEAPLADELGILWGWNPVTADWEEKPNRLPIYRQAAAMAYDAKRERIVLAGGHRGCYGVGGGPKICNLADTWEWEFFDFDPTCGVAACGDGYPDPGEDCDDAAGCCANDCRFRPAGSSCPAECPQGTCDASGSCDCPNLCGNGIVDAGEACDPGLGGGNGCCDSTCKVQVGSLCSAGADCQQATCQPSGSCLCNVTCGNGIVEEGISVGSREECDPPGDCCSPKCRLEEAGAICGSACRGDHCDGATLSCGVGSLDPTGCTPASSAKGFVGMATGGTVSTPDGSLTLSIPGMAPVFEGTYGIAGGLTNSSYGVGTPETRILTARLLPEGRVFVPPGATLMIRWRDDDMNFVVDGTAVNEGNLRVYKDGVPIAGPCAFMPSCPADNCCDYDINMMWVKLYSFSEIVLVEGPACGAPSVATLSLTKMLPPAGDDGLAFAATFPAPTSPPDPDTAGLGIVLTAANGTLVDVTIPPGGYDKATKTGWKVDKKRTKWTWSHPKDGAYGGIVKATLAINAKKGVLKVGVKGAAGAYAVTPPAALALRFPGSDGCARAGLAESGRTCVVKSKGKSLVCK